MELTEDLKKLIDKMSYESLLRKWRFDTPGTNSIFAGDSGEYYAERMAELKASDPAGAVDASKRIGWER